MDEKFEKLKETFEVDIDYKSEYYRLKKVETENKKLRDTIVNMSIYMFQAGIDMTKVLEEIDKSLRKLSRR